MKNWACSGPLPTLRNPFACLACSSEKEGVGRKRERLKNWQSCWQGGDAELLACLGQTIIQGKNWRWLVTGRPESLYQGCCLHLWLASGVWQHWIMWTKCLSRHGWFEHRILHPFCLLESQCVEPNSAAWHFSLLFRFSCKALYSSLGLGKDGNGGCKVLMKPT